jgi:hypothetical protein
MLWRVTTYIEATYLPVMAEGDHIKCPTFSADFN